MRCFFSERITGRIYVEEKWLRDYQVMVRPSEVNHRLRTQSDTHLFLLFQVFPQPAEKKNVKNWVNFWTCISPSTRAQKNIFIICIRCLHADWMNPGSLWWDIRQEAQGSSLYQSWVKIIYVGNSLCYRLRSKLTFFYWTNLNIHRITVAHYDIW